MRKEVCKRFKKILFAIGSVVLGTACTMESSFTTLPGKDSEIDPSKIELSSDQTSVEVNEGSSTAVVLVFSKPAPKATSIEWSILDANHDFQASAGKVNVAKGASSARFQVNSIGDAIYEGDESFTLSIKGDHSVFREAVNLPIILSENLDAPVVSVAPATASVVEDVGTHGISLTIDKATSMDTKVSFSLSGTATSGVDYTALTSLLATIPAGSTSVEIPLALLDDGDLEVSETVVLTLNSVTEGFGSVSPTAKIHTLNIQDNDTGVFAIRGVFGGADETKDAFLTSGTHASIAWNLGTGDTGYSVAIFESDGTTEKCAAVALANSITSHAFSSCGLTEGQAYVATVIAAHGDGDKIETLAFAVDTLAPMAVLSGAPSGTSYATSLDIDVGGAGVIGYSYKLGPSNLTDCTTATGYSSTASESVDMTNDLSIFGDGELKVCAIAVDAAGNWQNYSEATSVTWTQAVSTLSVNFAAATQSVNEPSGWKKRMKLNFDNTAQTETLTDFPVLVTLDPSKIDYADFKIGGADIYFTDNSGNQLSHQIEKWDSTGASFLWVKVPSIAASSSSDFIWMYYSNENETVSQDPSGVWSNGYSNVYHLGEASAVDALGNASSTVNGGSVSANGLIGSAYEFDGNTQYIDTGILPDNSFRTLEAWVYYSSTPTGSIGANDSSNHRFYVGALSSSSLWGGIGGGSETPSTTTSAGNWYYLVISGDGSNGRIYRNGVALGSGFSYAFSGASAKTITIGARNHSSLDSYIGGLVDEVRVSTVQRSPSWIAAQYSSMTGSFINYTSPEDITPATVDVTVIANLSEPHTSDVTIPFTVSGSADPTSDHNLANGSIVIAAGQTSESLTFQVLDDQEVENPEEVVITMGSPGPGIALVDPTIHTLTINDTDSFEVIEKLEVSEGWESLTLGFSGANTDPSMSYEIFYNTTGSVTTSDTMVTATTNPATLEGLTAGTTYFVRVRKLKNGLRSGLSAEVSGTPRTHFCSSGSPSTDCTIITNATLASGNTLYINGNLTIGDGTTPTVLAGPATEPVTIRVGGNLIVKAGASIAANAEIHGTNVIIEVGGFINATGLGYRGGLAGRGQGQGPGGTAGESIDTPGAGHGGAGGADDDSSGGSTYGSSTSPVTYGSGSGASSNGAGANGGGAIKIVAGNNITVNGAITANGSNGVGNSIYAPGGGAGGSIWLQAPNLLGTGQIHAIGGAGTNASYDGGGGGGGRIAIELSGSWSKTVTISVAGGSATDAGNPGFEGTYHMTIPSTEALCDSGSLASGGCVIGTNSVIPRDWILNGVDLTIASGVSVTSIGQGVGVWSFSGDVNINGSWSGNLTSLNAANLHIVGSWIGATASLSTANFSIPGNWTGDINDLIATNLTITGTMNANIANSMLTNVDVQSTGLLSANGRGYLGGIASNGVGQGPGGTAGESSDTSGAGHGGAGGADNDSSGGASYGSATAPVTFGSGAGAVTSTKGGNGGGAIKLVATNNITIDGTVSANGSDGSVSSIYASGGGAGGSVWLRAPNLLGAGQIHAKGGSGKNYSSNSSGGGGGGRVAIELSVSWSEAISVSVVGGTATNSANPGSEGTYHLSIPSFDMLCDSGSLTSGGCVIGSNKSIPADWDLSGIDLTISSGASITNIGQGSSNWNFSGDVSVAGSWSGDLTSLTAANLTVSGNWTGDINDLIATNLIVAGTMNTNIASSALTNLDVQSTGLLSANGRGYLGGIARNGAGQGPGGTVGDSSDTSGAGHGGVGGADNDSSGGVSYGSVTAPVTFGSGSGAHHDGNGASGGGALKIVASNNITIDGTVSANGADGAGVSYYGSGGGAGGSVWLQAPNLLGAGFIHAKGGTGANKNSDSGGGGGGRISVEVTSAWSDEISVSVAGGSASVEANPGSEGTYHLSIPSAEMLCDSGSFASGGCVIGSNKSIPRDWNLSGIDFTISSGTALTAVGQGAGAWNFSGDVNINGSWSGDLTSLNAANLNVVGSWSGATEYLSTANFSILGTWSGDVADLAATNLIIAGTMNANIANASLADVDVQSTGLLSANGRGHHGGRLAGVKLGLGPGGSATETSDTAGAGHGGDGGADNDSIGGVSYGSGIAPVTYGSGSGAVSGGDGADGGGDGADGGGAIRIVASNSITVNGVISANGMNAIAAGYYAPGGGAGGSIWLQTPSLLGTGQVHAKGGDGADAYYDGGGGGGGRIALYHSSASFANYSVDGGWGYNGVNGSAGSFFESSAAAPQLIFVTSATSTGAFGDLSAADDFCAVTAKFAGISGRWLALMSEATGAKASDLPITGPVYNMRHDTGGGPVKVADDAATLWDGNLDAPVAFTENGTASVSTVWTGTISDGSASADQCSNWSTSSDIGTIGDAAAANSTWIEGAVPASCTEQHAVYCLLQ